MDKCSSSAFSCCQEQGTLLVTALGRPLITVPMEISPLNPLHPVLSQNVLHNTLLSSPGVASVVAGHPLDTVKVKIFELCSHVTTRTPTNSDFLSR